MSRKPNTILKSIVVPFLLVFITLFLTHIGMQTQLMDRELDRFIAQSATGMMNIIWNYFVTEEVKEPMRKLACMADSLLPDSLDTALKNDVAFSCPLLSSQWDTLKHDLLLDNVLNYVALFDRSGRMILQESFMAAQEKESHDEFRNQIMQRKVTAEIFGFDKAPHASHSLVAKMIFPIRNRRGGILGYMAAIRNLDNRFFEKVHQLTGLHVLVFSDGTSVFSTLPIHSGEQLAVPPKIREKVYHTHGQPSESAQRVFILNDEYRAVSFPIENLQGEAIGALMLLCSLEGKEHSLKKIVLNLLWASLMGGILLLFFGFLISRGITIPINQLIQATRCVSAGDFDTRADVQSHKELITLSQAFNGMTDNLKRTSISRNYFQTILDTMNDLLIIVSPDRSIEFVNQTTVNVLGYTSDEMIGKSFDHLFHHDCPFKGMDFENIVQKEGGQDSSCIMLTKAGETIPVSFSWSVMRNEKNDLTQIIGIARDIREKAEAEQKIREERDKLNTLINTTNDLIFIRTLKGEITFVSHAVHRILGYSPEEFKSLPPEKILSANPLNQAFIESPSRWSTRSEKAEPYWVEFLTSDGRPIFLEINETPLQGKGNEITQVMGIGRDISERKRLEEQLREWHEKQAKTQQGICRFGDVIGKSRRMQEIYDFIQVVSQNNSTVLLKGESGTGKEMIAQSIHDHSPRCNYPFVEVTCSVLSEYLLESELFGHVKGAFTGAIKDKQGRFEQASGGTIFLDEIGDVSLNAQIKLLRVLQEREIVRVGGDERIKVDVRIIAATNKNLEEAVARGTFREDLYYRLNVVPIDVPALRERKEDIPLLVEHFIAKINQKVGKNIIDMSQKAVNILMEYYWPGNIRQLENAVEYAIIRCQGAQIKVQDLPAEIRNQKKGEKASMHDLIANTEKSAFLEALQECQWDLTQTAQRLNISRTTLWRKIKKYRIERPRG
ncbi:MAG: sigma 54-interacting transcriptional regulator [bacterium]